MTITITNPTAPATDAQRSYALGLYPQAYPYVDGDENYAEAQNAFAEFVYDGNKGEVSAMITNLKDRIAANRVVAAATQIAVDAAPAPTGVLTSGIYRTPAGDVYKVQAARQTGHLYAKALTPIGGRRMIDADESVVGFEFTYAAGAIRTLNVGMRMTLDEAIQFGIRYGVCCNCGKGLKDAKSVAAGIGPVCAKKFA